MKFLYILLITKSILTFGTPKTCPVMRCIPRDSEQLIGVSNKTCYNWATHSDPTNMIMLIKQCPYDDQICDVFSISDKNAYTQLNPSSNEGYYQEKEYFSNKV